MWYCVVGDDLHNVFMLQCGQTICVIIYTVDIQQKKLMTSWLIFQLSAMQQHYKSETIGLLPVYVHSSKT